MKVYLEETWGLFPHRSPDIVFSHPSLLVFCQLVGGNWERRHVSGETWAGSGCFGRKPGIGRPVGEETRVGEILKAWEILGWEETWAE